MKVITPGIFAACGMALLLSGCAQDHATNPADQSEKKPHQICLNADQIDHLSYPDDKTILFHMRGGKVKIWKNTLQNACPNMKFQGGIAYEIKGGTICGNMQTFHVISYWTPCMMGAFTPYTPPKKAGDSEKKN